MTSNAKVLSEEIEGRKDKFKTGVVVKFQAKFSFSDNWFEYAAIKANKVWSLTGVGVLASQTYTEDQFVDILAGKTFKVRNVKVATAWDKV